MECDTGNSRTITGSIPLAANRPGKRGPTEGSGRSPRAAATAAKNWPARAKAFVPDGTDVTANDRIASVTYLGQTIIDGPVDIRAVLPRPGDHLELVLVQVG